MNDTARYAPSPATDAAPRGLTGRVLVIDDEEGLRELLQEILASADFEVVTAGDATTGLAQLETGTFDLVLTDLMLPDLNGLDVLNRVRQHGEDLPVLIVTGQGTLSTAIEAIQEGAHDYILKPFRADELLERVKRASERRLLQLQNKQLLDDLRTERSLLQVRVEEATASLREHLRQVEQMNAELSALFALVSSIRGKPGITDVIDTMIQYLTPVIPFGRFLYLVFDANGSTVAQQLPDGSCQCNTAGQALTDASDTLSRVLRDTADDGFNLRQLREILAGSGMHEDELERFMIKPFAVGQLLFGMMLLCPCDNETTFTDRHHQVFSLAMAQMAGACEESLLLEHGTQLLTMGQLVSEIVHDVRSPLTSIINNAKYLRDRYSEDADAQRSLADVIESGTQMGRLIEELLSFSKPDEIQLGHANVNEIVTMALRMTQNYLKKKSIQLIQSDIDPRLYATGNDHHLVEALVNLVVNATQAMDEGGTLTVNVQPNVPLEHEPPGTSTANAPARAPAAGQRFVRISITDTGCGIDPKNLNKVFHRYYTTKSAGTGLGLSSVLRIIRQNLGYIALESEVGVGTTAHVYLLH